MVHPSYEIDTQNNKSRYENNRRRQADMVR